MKNSPHLSGKILIFTPFTETKIQKIFEGLNFINAKCVRLKLKTQKGKTIFGLQLERTYSKNHRKVKHNYPKGGAFQPYTDNFRREESFLLLRS